MVILPVMHMLTIWHPKSGTVLNFNVLSQVPRVAMICPPRPSSPVFSRSSRVQGMRVAPGRQGTSGRGRQEADAGARVFCVSFCALPGRNAAVSGVGGRGRGSSPQHGLGGRSERRGEVGAAWQPLPGPELSYFNIPVTLGAGEREPSRGCFHCLWLGSAQRREAPIGRPKGTLLCRTLPCSPGPSPEPAVSSRKSRQADPRWEQLGSWPRTAPTGLERRQQLLSKFAPNRAEHAQ